MKSFERLVKTYICDNIPAALQFAHWPDRSVEHAVLHVLHTALEDLKGRNTYSVSDSSILALLFDTTMPTKLVFKPGPGSFHLCLGVYFLYYFIWQTPSTEAGRNPLFHSNSKHGYTTGMLPGVRQLSMWCEENNLSTKEMIIDCRKHNVHNSPITDVSSSCCGEWICRSGL